MACLACGDDCLVVADFCSPSCARDGANPDLMEAPAMPEETEFLVTAEPLTVTVACDEPAAAAARWLADTLDIAGDGALRLTVTDEDGVEHRFEVWHQDISALALGAGSNTIRAV